MVQYVECNPIPSFSWFRFPSCHMHLAIVNWHYPELSSNLLLVLSGYVQSPRLVYMNSFEIGIFFVGIVGVNYSLNIWILFLFFWLLLLVYGRYIYRFYMSCMIWNNSGSVLPVVVVWEGWRRAVVLLMFNQIVRYHHYIRTLENESGLQSYHSKSNFKIACDVSTSQMPGIARFSLNNAKIDSQNRCRIDHYSSQKYRCNSDLFLQGHL